MNREWYRFFSNFKSEDLNEIRNDLQLINDGYKFVYITDSYDILRYVLPERRYLNENLEQQNISKLEKQSNKAIYYDSVFGSESDMNFLLLDEYKLELLYIKNSLQKKMEKFQIEKFNLSRYLKENDFIKIKEIVNKNLNILTAILLFNHSQDNVYGKFSEFISKINKFENDEDNNFIENMFHKAQATTKTNHIFERFAEDSQMRLISLNSDYERIIYLENAYRDIQVIDRIFEAYNMLSDNKYAFVYLSSTPYKTNKLFNIISDLEYQFPEVGKIKKYKFNRNVFQCFLLQFLRKQDKREELLENMITEFNQIQQLSLEENKINTNDSVIKAFNDLIVKYDTNFKNSIFYEKYDYYATKLQSLSVNTSKSALLTELIEIANKDIDLYKAFSLPEMKISNIIDLKNTNILINRMKKHNFIDISFGQDIIRNSYQHLPCLSFIYSTDILEEKFINSFFELSNSILNPKSKAKQLCDKIKKPIENLLSQLNEVSFKTYSAHPLCLSLLYLITRETLDEKLTYIPEEIYKDEKIINFLKSKRKALEAAGIVFQGNDKRITITNKDNALLIEFDYLLLWLYRRIGKFDESILLGEESLEKYSKDARFYHGLALACIAKAYNLISKNESEIQELIIPTITRAIDFLVKALEFYKSIMIDNFQNNLAEIICKTKIAIYNTIIDSKIRICRLREDPNISSLELEDISLYVSEMIKLCKEIDDGLISDPTISHTISEFNYLLAYFYYSSRELEKAREKILESTTYIAKFEGTEEIVKYFTKIISDISELRYKIFKDLGYFRTYKL